MIRHVSPLTRAPAWNHRTRSGPRTQQRTQNPAADPEPSSEPRTQQRTQNPAADPELRTRPRFPLPIPLILIRLYKFNVSGEICPLPQMIHKAPQTLLTKTVEPPPEAAKGPQSSSETKAVSFCLLCNRSCAMPHRTPHTFPRDTEHE